MERIGWDVTRRRRMIRLRSAVQTSVQGRVWRHEVRSGAIRGVVGGLQEERHRTRPRSIDLPCLLHSKFHGADAVSIAWCLTSTGSSCQDRRHSSGV